MRREIFIVLCIAYTDAYCFKPGGGFHMDNHYMKVSVCTICEPGFFCTNMNWNRAPCGENTYSGEGWSSCLACPAGSECPDGVIRDCATGFYSTTEPHSVCSECKENEHHTSDRTACVEQAPTCDAGWWCDGHYFQVSKATKMPRVSTVTN
jgi:hypothetical protein